MDLNLIQFALLIPIGILVGWVRLLHIKVDKMISTTYSKEETTEMIKLHIAPLETKIDHVNETCAEIKTMLQGMKNNGNKDSD